MLRCPAGRSQPPYLPDVRLRISLIALFAAAACVPPAPPAPPAPTTPTRDTAAARDSAEREARAIREARRADSIAVAERERAKREAATIRVCAGGDVALGTNLDTMWAVRAAKAAKRKRIDPLPDPARLIAPLRPLVEDADVVLLNVEGAIGDSTPPFAKCGKKSTGCYAIRMPSAAAAAIRKVNERAIVVANLANNHARDAGAEGLEVTRRLLGEAGVVMTGVDTLATVVETPAGDTIAFLGFATSGPPNDARDLEAVRRHVERAVAAYRRVVVTMHLGAEGKTAQRTRDSVEIYFEAPRGNPVAFADVAAGAGADLVIGHGPHVLRAAEWRDGTLVLYSLGNLLTYGPFSHGEPMRRGAVACATVDGRGAVSEARLHPTVQTAPGRVASDRRRRAIALVDSLSKLDFPRTGARVERDGTIGAP